MKCPNCKGYGYIWITVSVGEESWEEQGGCGECWGTGEIDSEKLTEE